MRNFSACDANFIAQFIIGWFPTQLLAPTRASAAAVLSKKQRRTLRAAVARIVPATSPGDWSAADVGADEYILGLLTGASRIYAGGPTRKRFARFQRLSRVKRIGWNREVRSLRRAYRRGLAELDTRAGGDFAALPGPVQDAILTELDDRGSEFFGLLLNHTMEGVYAPRRLQVLDPCLTVEGTVRDDIQKAEDGDITFGLYLSEADQRLINDVNRANYDSALHIEIVPEDQPLVLPPKPGDKIRITGPWVTDTAHGHNEIHPAFKIEKID